MKKETLYLSGSTRRDFIHQAATLGAMGALATVIGSGPALANTPKKGGRLRVGASEGYATDNLDPAVMKQDIIYVACLGGLRNCLVEIDANAKAVPELAQSWEANKDATVWTLKLRPGVEFHNGKTFDVDDAIWSINHHRGKDSKSTARLVVSDIQDLKADGGDLVVTLSRANADFPYVLADPHIQMVPNGTKGADYDKGIGTGGYSLIDFAPGQRVLIKRNPNYFKTDRAHFDEVEALAIPDPTARISALLSDRVDVINRCDPKLVGTVTANPSFKVIAAKGFFYYCLDMLADTAPFNNNDMRLALKYAIDRDAALKLLLRGYGSIANDHPVPSTNVYFAKNLPQRTYDPDKAKFHLKKAGYDTIALTFTTGANTFVGALDLATLFRENAAKAGITINIERVPDDGYSDKIIRHRPLCASYFSGRPNADLTLFQWYGAGARTNEMHYDNARIATLLNEARGLFDQAKRAEMYGEMQSLIRDDGSSIIPLFQDYVHAGSQKLGYGQVAGDREFDGGRISERWWFA